MEQLDFSAFGELVEAVNESNKPAAPAPVSENPDRQNYQSGVVGSARQFEPEALPQRGQRGTDVSNMQQALVDAGVTSIKKVDGAFGINTEKGVQEFQEMRGLPETGIFDEATRSALFDDTTRMPDSDEPTVPAPDTVSQSEIGANFGIVSKNLPISESDWEIYREEVAKIESGGKYDIKGGANNHYDGRYQLGKMAKLDAAQLLGIDLGHSAEDRKTFRTDPELQEKAFAAYTAQNHKYLSNKSEKYRNLPTKEKLAVLGYAHNQGWGGAKKWLETGVEGRDAFGTSGAKYYNALTSAMEAK